MLVISCLVPDDHLHLSLVQLHQSLGEMRRAARTRTGHRPSSRQQTAVLGESPGAAGMAGMAGVQPTGRHNE